MSAKIISFPGRELPNFAEFPDGYDAAIIYCALIEAGEREPNELERADIEAILDRIFNVEQNQSIEWGGAFQAFLQREGRP